MTSDIFSSSARWAFGRPSASRWSRAGEAVFVRDAAKDPDFVVVAPGTRQAIIVPLKRGESEVLGILVVESAGAPILTEDDFALLLLLAHQISVAVANARLFAEQRASEQRYRLITENSLDLIRLIDLADLRSTYASPAFQTVLGYEPAKMLGAPRWDLVHPEDLSDTSEQFREMVRCGTAKATYRLLHANGSWRWIESQGSVITEQGRRYAIVAGRDITERKRLEAEQRARAAAEAAIRACERLGHAHPDHRDDRPRDARRSRALPGGRHG